MHTISCSSFLCLLHISAPPTFCAWIWWRNLFANKMELNCMWSKWTEPFHCDSVPTSSPIYTWEVPCNVSAYILGRKALSDILLRVKSGFFSSVWEKSACHCGTTRIYNWSLVRYRPVCRISVMYTSYWSSTLRCCFRWLIIIICIRFTSYLLHDTYSFSPTLIKGIV